jgi:ATP-dependent helicase HrpB
MPSLPAPSEPAPPSGPFNLGAIGAGLVFADSLGQLADALKLHGASTQHSAFKERSASNQHSASTGSSGAGGAAIVQAPPGTGKTTLVPPLVANLLSGASGSGVSGKGASGNSVSGQEVQFPRVVVTQPRRVAARSAARRLASLDGSRLGERIGYTVRGERQAGAGTIIEFVTPGILLRRLLSDPGLEGTAAVILDEVHERGLETDLLFGMLSEVRQLRGDLTFVAMSATLDAARFAALTGGGPTDAGQTGKSPDGEYDGGGPAPVVHCPSALHRLAVEWAPAPGPRLDERGVTRAFLDHVAATAAAAYADALDKNPDADALVFLPGAWEVSQVAARLRGRVSADVLELHGQVSPAGQDRAVSGRDPGGPPRIIVSTALAESSLTVPGVRLVIDAGLSRELRRDAARGMSGLVTVSCSRASAEQRAGRAARQGPGTVVRCYDQKAFGAAPAHPAPEIAAADLTGAALLLACWGSPRGEGLPLPDAPPKAAMDEAVEVLRELGAVKPDGYATELGKILAAIPADPRLGRALLAGAAAVGRRTAAETVAVVSGDHRAPGADLPGLLVSLRAGKDPASIRWAEEVRRLEAITRREGSAGHRPGRTAAPAISAAGADAAEAAGFVVALAFPDRVARRVSGGGPERYQLTSGTRAGLPAGSPLSGHEWLAVAEVARTEGRDAAGTGAVIRSAAPLTAEQAETAARQLLVETVEAQFNQGRISARRERRLGAIVLAATPVKPSAEEGRTAVRRALEREGLQAIGWSTAADALRRRLALLRRELGAPWPEVSEDALLSRLEEWLAPELEALAGGTAADRIDLAEPLRRLLPWPEASRLDELAPEALKVPSGTSVRIDYPDVNDGGRPVVAVKLQECFGWAATPRLADGKVPVLFHLLSPARRPLAVTDDLASFWSGPYAQVRAEMRGRYPKHPWPEDPWSAPATSRTKARM